MFSAVITISLLTLIHSGSSSKHPITDGEIPAMPKQRRTDLYASMYDKKNEIKRPMERDASNPGVLVEYSYTPSSSPSSLPSSLPSPSPSLSLLPSSSPSASPSFSSPPSLFGISCSIDDNGIYGIDDDTLTPVDVSYKYEVETDPNIQGDMTADILPAIERAILENLIPLYFTYCRGGQRFIRDRRYLLEGNRHLEIVGISPLPLDSPADRECQVETTNDNNNCTSINGALRLFSQGNQSNEKVAAIEAIKAGMGNNAFVSSHEAIVKINYIEERTTEVRNDESGPTVKTRTSQNSNIGVQSEPLSVRPFIIVSGAVAFLVVAAEGTRRYLGKRRRIKEDEFGGLGSVTGSWDDVMNDAMNSRVSDILA